MLNRSTLDHAPVARRVSSKAVSKFSDFEIEQLEDRKLMSTTYDIGINLNDSTAAGVSKMTPILKNLGVQTLRLWYTVSNFNDHTFGTVLQRAIDYKNNGFDIDLEINTKNGAIPSASAVKGWFTWAVSNSSLKAAVDRWEIGNEPDHNEYWQGTLSQYVSTYLEPAYEALHAAGETVVSAGPSWNPQDVQTMINSGMLNYTDYVGFHPYGTGVTGVINDLKQINAVVAGRKPIALTEWNVRGFESGSKAAWAAAVQQVYPYIKEYSALNYYFAAKTQNSPAGPGGILTASYTPNAYFYNAFATFEDASTPSDGNTGAGVPASISGTLWGDLDGDGVIDSGESVAAGRTVFIDTNGNGKLDSGETSTTSDSSGKYKFTGLKAGTYKISRVFPDGYKISNSTTADVTATVATSQSLTGVNIGSIAIKTTTPTPTPTTPTPTSTTASISGTLWGDSDADGVIDSGEPVAAGRTVFLDTNGNGKLDAGEVFTTTNSSGKYTFSGLKAGTYNVGRVFPSGYKISNSTTADITATVTAGQALTGVNIGSTTVGTKTSTPVVTTAPAVTGFALYNTLTGQVISTYSNVTSNLTISLASLATNNIAVVALTNTSTSSLKLTALGKTVTQNDLPYAFFGDQGAGKYNAWAAAKGSYTFTATAYSADNLAGTVGNTLSVTITFA